MGWSFFEVPHTKSCPAKYQQQSRVSCVAPRDKELFGFGHLRTARKPTSMFRIVHWVVGSSRLGFQRVQQLFSILPACDRPVAVEVPKPISSLWRCGPTGRQSLKLWDVLGRWVVDKTATGGAVGLIKTARAGPFAHRLNTPASFNSLCDLDRQVHIVLMQTCRSPKFGIDSQRGGQASASAGRCQSWSWRGAARVQPGLAQDCCWLYFR